MFDKTGPVENPLTKDQSGLKASNSSFFESRDTRYGLFIHSVHERMTLLHILCSGAIHATVGNAYSLR